MIIANFTREKLLPLFSSGFLKPAIFILCLLYAPVFFAQDMLWETEKEKPRTLGTPNSADLNGDGVEDIVIGSIDTNSPMAFGEGLINAYDGATGEVLWEVSGRGEIYTMPRFMDITNDGVPEVFIGGRYAQYVAINGATGEVVWEFWESSEGNWFDEYWGNFYTGTFIPDQNNDGVMDIVNMNGGGAASEFELLPGRLVVLSGANGNILAQAGVPNVSEAFNSPIVVDFLGDGNTSIIYGTGGETLGGGYYKVSLSSLMQSNINSSVPLVESDNKGFINPAALVDLTGDGVYDMVFPHVDEKISAMDGATLETLWEYTVEGTESYTPISVGQFTDDDIPDVFGIMQTGAYLNYENYQLVVLDGTDGSVVWENNDYLYQLGGPAIVDYDNDGYDEVIIQLNFEHFNPLLRMGTQLSLIDINDGGTITPLDEAANGFSFATTPLVRDIDDNGMLDVVYTYVHTDNPFVNFQEIAYSIRRVELDINPDQIAWGAYLGTFGDASYPYNLTTPTEEVELTDSEIMLYPNPTAGELNIEVTADSQLEDVYVTNLVGQTVQANSTDLYQLDISNLQNGIYFINLKINNQWMVRKVALSK